MSEARRVSELDPDLVTLALCQQVLVIDVDALAIEMAEHAGESPDANLIEKALESGLSYELGAYRVIARAHDDWDAVLALLAALDEEHHDYLEQLLERCCAISAEVIAESGGLRDVLSGLDWKKV